MANCMCSDTKHGHGNPCGKPTAGSSQKCNDCEKAAKEFAGTRQGGTAQDIPPGKSR
jgi:hypothetical protein